MPTLADVFPREKLVKGPVHIEPGKDVKHTTDATGAFKDKVNPGALPVEGATESAVVTHKTNLDMGQDNCIATVDAHVPGAVHSAKSYTEEAGIVLNVTELTPELIAGWERIGESRILTPRAKFGLGVLPGVARLTRMVTGRWQTIWTEHGIMGGPETLLIAPVTTDDYSDILSKGTNPLYDSHSSVMDASGKPVGSLETLAMRREPLRNLLCDGNAFEVCIYLSLKHFAQAAKLGGWTVYCIVDAVGFLPFIDQKVREALIEELIALGVKFVHSSQLRFN